MSSIVTLCYLQLFCIVQIPTPHLFRHFQKLHEVLAQGKFGLWLPLVVCQTPAGCKDGKRHTWKEMKRVMNTHQGKLGCIVLNNAEISLYVFIYIYTCIPVYIYIYICTYIYIYYVCVFIYFSIHLWIYRMWVFNWFRFFSFCDFWGSAGSIFLAICSILDLEAAISTELQIYVGFRVSLGVILRFILGSI